MRPDDKPLRRQPPDLGVRHRVCLAEAASQIVLKRSTVTHMTDRNKEGCGNAQIPQVLDGPDVIFISIIKRNRRDNFLILPRSKPRHCLIERDHGVVTAEELDLRDECFQRQTHVIDRTIRNHMGKEDADRGAMVFDPSLPEMHEPGQ